MSAQVPVQISVSKEAIHEMPVTHFPGAIHLADTPELVDAAVEALMGEAVIGFDTETKPSFHKGVVNKMALMQLSTLTDCYLIRINRTGITPSLQRLIESPDVKKIGLSIHDDFSVLHRSSAAAPSAFVELQQYVKRFGIIDASLQRIYAILFGEKISKSQRLTNWEADKLTDKQQHYAAIDAWACLRIWLYLESGQFRPEYSPYVVLAETIAAAKAAPTVPAKPAPDSVRKQSNCNVKGTAKDTPRKSSPKSADKATAGAKAKSRKRASKKTVRKSPADNAAKPATDASTAEA